MCRFHRTLSVFVAGLLVWGGVALADDDFDDFNELDLSALLDQVVVTATKTEQKIGDAPVAAYVITADDIAASGVMSIPELLVDVPGLDMFVPTASHFDVSARGLNEPGSNTILVLLDGRSVYADFYGLTLWEYLPVTLEEIKAIEVILGPGSAFYGANAFACVINIITFSPEEQEGTQARSAASTYGDVLVSATHAGANEKFGWRLGASRKHDEDWETERHDSDISRVHGRLDRTWSPDSRTTVTAGLSRGDIYFVPSTESMVLDGTAGFVSADYTWGDLQVRWFWDSWNLDVEPVGDLAVLSEISALDSDVHDVEVRHVLRPGGGHLLQWGGGYRHKTVDWTLQRQAYSQDILSAFLYDEWSPSERLRLSLGLRYDDHPLVGGRLAPRGGLVYHPHPRHALRATAGIAYRDPSYLESYWYTEIAGPLGMTQTVRGDLDLGSEEIRSFEVGYQGLVLDNLMASVSLFRNEVRDLIDIVVVENFPSPPMPLPGIPSEIAFANDENWNITGGEVALETRLGRGLEFRGHWAYVHGEDAGSQTPTLNSPSHIATASLSWTPAAAHRLELRGRYRSATQWHIGTLSGPGEKQDGDERLAVDLRWHWRPSGDRAHVVLSLENALDDRYRDHPLVIEQWRRLAASVRMGF